MNHCIIIFSIKCDQNNNVKGNSVYIMLRKMFIGFVKLYIVNFSFT